jgi:hypothetical protein
MSDERKVWNDAIEAALKAGFNFKGESGSSTWHSPGDPHAIKALLKGSEPEPPGECEHGISVGDYCWKCGLFRSTAEPQVTVPEDLKQEHENASNCARFSTKCFPCERIQYLIERLGAAEQRVTALTKERDGADRRVDVLVEQKLLAELDYSELQDERDWLKEKLAVARRNAWFADFRPIINAIGELSVQEAMDAIERSL